ncbi:hypothetical protein [Geminocystis herdmanii]|uniref:hypothetical protein n=1 Tax=Geminocystis herdmanii TaxID=669359 RepID=UPI00034CF08F|nr:hypothetical protein [Geminocystis herdmanii]
MIYSFYGGENKQDYIAIDGKTLKSPMTDYQEESQNKLKVISAFICEENLIIEKTLLI